MSQGIGMLQISMFTYSLIFLICTLGLARYDATHDNKLVGHAKFHDKTIESSDNNNSNTDVQKLDESDNQLSIDS